VEILKLLFAFADYFQLWVEIDVIFFRFLMKRLKLFSPLHRDSFLFYHREITQFVHGPSLSSLAKKTLTQRALYCGSNLIKLDPLGGQTGLFK